MRLLLTVFKKNILLFDIVSDTHTIFSRVENRKNAWNERVGQTLVKVKSKDVTRKYSFECFAKGRSGARAFRWGHIVFTFQDLPSGFLEIWRWRLLNT